MDGTVKLTNWTVFIWGPQGQRNETIKAYAGTYALPQVSKRKKPSEVIIGIQRG